MRIKLSHLICFCLVICRGTAFAEVEQCTRGLAAKVKASETGSVPLDFDGDGYSDIGTALVGQDKTVSFSVTLSANNSVLEGTVSGMTQAVGDYDGDGKADLAAVSLARDENGGGKQFDALLTFLPTANPTVPQTLRISLGQGADDKVNRSISGCRLLSANRSAFAVVSKGSQSQGFHKILVREFGSDNTTSIDFKHNLTFVGCGDLDGDNKDELLFTKKASKKSDDLNIVSAGCGKKPVIYRAVKPFDKALFVPRDSGLLPIVAFLRMLRPGRFSMDVQGISEQIPYARTLTSGQTDVSSALLKSTSDTGQSAILLRKNGSNDILASYVGVQGTNPPVKIGTVANLQADLLRPTNVQTF